jgi:hypothetical protein
MNNHTYRSPVTHEIIDCTVPKNAYDLMTDHFERLAIALSNAIDTHDHIIIMTAIEDLEDAYTLTPEHDIKSAALDSGLSIDQPVTLLVSDRETGSIDAVLCTVPVYSRDGGQSYQAIYDTDRVSREWLDDSYQVFKDQYDADQASDMVKALRQADQVLAVTGDVA